MGSRIDDGQQLNLPPAALRLRAISYASNPANEYPARKSGPSGWNANTSSQ